MLKQWAPLQGAALTKGMPHVLRKAVSWELDILFLASLLDSLLYMT